MTEDSFDYAYAVEYRNFDTAHHGLLVCEAEADAKMIATMINDLADDFCTVSIEDAEQLLEDDRIIDHIEEYDYRAMSWEPNIEYYVWDDFNGQYAIVNADETCCDLII